MVTFRTHRAQAFLTSVLGGHNRGQNAARRYRLKQTSIVRTRCEIRREAVCFVQSSLTVSEICVVVIEYFRIARHSYESLQVKHTTLGQPHPYSQLHQSHNGDCNYREEEGKIWSCVAVIHTS